MRFLHVGILRKEEKIVLEFNCAEAKENPGRGISMALLGFFKADKSISEWMKDLHVYSKPEMLSCLEEQILESEFLDKSADRPQKYELSSMTYVLPTNPVLAFAFLEATDRYISTRMFQAVRLSELDFPSQFLLNEGSEIASSTKNISEIFKIDDSENNRGLEWLLLAKNLLSTLSALPSYEDVFKTFNSMISSTTVPTERLGFTFPDLNTRLNICMESLGLPNFMNSSLSPAERINQLYQLERKLIGANKKELLNSLIDALNFNAKLKLFEACLNQRAYDGNKYNMDYTEWALLKFAEFNIRSDGRVSILLADNEGYQEFYALGTANHSIMKDEFNHLFMVLGLELAEDTNFDKELVFTKKSSEDLIEKRLHHSKTYLQNVLRVKNSFIEYKNRTVQFNLSIFKIISKHACASLTTKIDPSELDAAQNLGWNRNL